MSIFGISETTTKTNATTYSSKCDIEFAPGDIEIKQLSFVSCQHVVAYCIGGLIHIDHHERDLTKKAEVSQNCRKNKYKGGSQSTVILKF